MSKEKEKQNQVVLIEPAVSRDYDTHVLTLEKETWEEVTDYLEEMLEAHFLDHGWHGELNIRLQFTNADGGEEDGE